MTSLPDPVDSLAPVLLTTFRLRLHVREISLRKMWSAETTGPCNCIWWKPWWICWIHWSLCCLLSYDCLSVFLSYVPENYDLLESLVLVMVFNKILTGFTGFTGPCRAYDVLTASVCPWDISQKAKSYWNHWSLEVIINEIPIGFTRFTGPCSAYDLLTALVCL